MPKDYTPGKPTTRRYSEQEKKSAVRLVRTLRAELGSDHGTVEQVASQFSHSGSSHERGDAHVGRQDGLPQALPLLGARTPHAGGDDQRGALQVHDRLSTRRRTAESTVR